MPSGKALAVLGWRLVHIWNFILDGALIMLNSNYDQQAINNISVSLFQKLNYYYRKIVIEKGSESQ